MSRVKVLIVDDERNILKALTRLFDDSGYELHTALSADEGFEILNRFSPFHVVVSDYEMPGMNGVEFLKKVAERWPDTVRMVLTVHEETQILIAAVNEGHIYKIILKPWDDEDFKATIANGVERYSLLLKNQELSERLAASNEELKRLNGYLEGRLAYLANYDPVTDMPNKSLFCDRITMATLRTQHHNRFVSVMIIGIDNFSFIVNTFGLQGTDNAIRKLSGRLAGLVRDGDTVARIETGEFGIALNDVAHEKDVIPIVQEVLSKIAEPVSVDSKELRVTASIGVSIHPTDSADPMVLLKNAWLSLNQARKAGGNTYAFYTPEMNEKALEFVEMEKRLIKALSNKDFILHYQPYFDIKTGDIKGIESLLRLKTEDAGLIMPARFIGILEETGLIAEAGRWVLEEVIRQIGLWQKKELRIVPVSINISGVQFRNRDLVPEISERIKDSGIDPGYFSFEITESTFIQDTDFAISAINALKALGVAILIDDFGTVYSSLNYLAKFNVDYLKVDISFIRGITKNETNKAIVRAVNSMAHSLGIKTIAEGVETEEQLRVAQTLGCDLVQGFLLSKPVPPEQLARDMLS